MLLSSSIMLRVTGVAIFLFTGIVVLAPAKASLTQEHLYVGGSEEGCVSNDKNLLNCSGQGCKDDHYTNCSTEAGGDKNLVCQHSGMCPSGCGDDGSTCQTLHW